ncbi:MAG: hypothetical protein AAFR66_16380 [Bacteroidota bacterium]
MSSNNQAERRTTLKYSILTFICWCGVFFLGYVIFFVDELPGERWYWEQERQLNDIAKRMKYVRFIQERRLEKERQYWKSKGRNIETFRYAQEEDEGKLAHEVKDTGEKIGP